MLGPATQTCPLKKVGFDLEIVPSDSVGKALCFFFFPPAETFFLFSLHNNDIALHSPKLVYRSEAGCTR